MLERVKDLYRKQGLYEIYAGGKRYTHWNISQYRTVHFWFRKLLAQNFERGICNGREVKFYYTHDAFLHCYGVLEDGMIARENIPLSILDIDTSLDAVIDVGGHYGIYSVLLKKLNPDSTLYTFEPDKNNFLVLQDLLAVNSLSGNVENKVVTGYTGTTTFYVDPKEGSENHSTTPASGFKEVEMPTVALSDHFDQKNISSAFIKIDVEGEEYNVLKDLFTADYSYIEGIVEIHPEKIDVEPEEIITFLESHYDECEFLSETSPTHRFGRPMYYFKSNS